MNKVAVFHCNIFDFVALKLKANVDAIAPGSIPECAARNMDIIGNHSIWIIEMAFYGYAIIFGTDKTIQYVYMPAPDNINAIIAGII